MNEIVIHDKHTLAKRDIWDLLELLNKEWPLSEGKPDMDELVRAYKAREKVEFNKVILFFSDNKLAGHAEIFQRDIYLDSEKIPVLALSGVCVDPRFRGNKIGLQLVQKAFSFVDNRSYSISLFQTNVPDFYKKLRCKLITNAFINSKSKEDPGANPWKDPNVMVYPDSVDVGNGIIDLNGACY